MITIRLENLLFHAFHGVHEEEKKLGNEYSVDVFIDFHEEQEVIIHIQDTLNYVTVYEMIRERMSIPTPLLETVAMEAGLAIYKKFPAMRSISVTIKKLHAPIPRMQGAVGVTWSRQFRQTAYL